MAQSPHIHSQQTGCDGPNFQGLRRLLYEPPDGSEVCTHTETLAILSRLAREGRTTAALGLEKALKGEQPASERGKLLQQLTGY